MPDENRDRDLIEHILRYCEQIETAHRDFDRSRERFDTSTTYQNAISMCILQIGELVGHLSDEFKAANTSIPWHKICDVVYEIDRSARNGLIFRMFGQRICIQVLLVSSLVSVKTSYTSR